MKKRIDHFEGGGW